MPLNIPAGPAGPRIGGSRSRRSLVPTLSAGSRLRFCRIGHAHLRVTPFPAAMASSPQRSNTSCKVVSGLYRLT